MNTHFCIAFNSNFTNRLNLFVDYQLLVETLIYCVVKNWFYKVSILLVASLFISIAGFGQAAPPSGPPAGPGKIKGKVIDASCQSCHYLQVANQ